MTIVRPSYPILNRVASRTPKLEGFKVPELRFKRAAQLCSALLIWKARPPGPQV